MKLKYVLLSGLFMSVGFAACTNDDFTEVQTPAVNTEDAISLGEGYTITVANGDADTRAYMEDLQTAVWEETDQLGAAWYDMITEFNDKDEVTEHKAFTKGTSTSVYSGVRLFSLDGYVGDSKKAANFKTTEPISAGAYVLYYPYESGQLTTAGDLTVSMLDEEGNLPAQTMDCNDKYAGISANMFAYSPVAFLNGGAQSTTENFTLNQLTNVFAIKFQVSANDKVFNLIKGVKIAKVIISANGTSGSVIPVEGTIKVPTVSDYNTGKIGEAEFVHGTEAADMLILDVANASDAYSIQELKKPTEAYYISTLPFSGNATSFTVQMLTEEGEVFAKTYSTSDTDGKKVVDAINKQAQKEGQLIQLTVTLEDLVDTKTIFTADQFKAQWEDALTAKDGATLNVAQPLDLSDMDLAINNKEADITITGKPVTVKSLDITEGSLTIDNELTVAGDVEVSSKVGNASQLATDTNGKLNVEGEMNVHGTTGELAIGTIAALNTDASGDVILNGDDKAALETVANDGTITLKGEIAIAEELTNNGVLKIQGEVNNNGVINQNKVNGITVSGTGVLNNNAGAELNINANTSVKFMNAAKTTKAAAAVINIAAKDNDGATVKLTASSGSENKGIINVDGTLDASNLTQTEADARIVIGEKAAKNSVILKASGSAVTGGRIMVASADQVQNNTNAPMAIEVADEKEIENIPGIVNVIMSGDFEISSTSKFVEAGHNFYIQDGSTITLDGEITMGSTVYIEGAVNVVAKGEKASWSLCAGGNTIEKGGVLTTGEGVTLKGNGTSPTLTINVGGELKNAEAIDSSLSVVKK